MEEPRSAPEQKKQGGRHPPVTTLHDELHDVLCRTILYVRRMHARNNIAAATCLLAIVSCIAQGFPKSEIRPQGRTAKIQQQIRTYQHST